jgi:hypothetical protein
MPEKEVIVEIGAAGGSITLFGIRSQRGWLYSMSVEERALEEGYEYDSDAVDTWEAALVLLDRYPWHLLLPMKVHSEFRQQIWVAVQRRFESSPKGEAGSYRFYLVGTRIEKWRELCGGTNDPS